MKPTRSTFLSIAAVCAVQLIPAVSTVVTAADRPPNVIVIMTDDQGYHDVGFNGCTDIPTPNLDSIARNGVRFSNGYVTYPVCSPSRAGMLTGRYQQRFGHERNPQWRPNDPNSGLPLTETTLADALGKVGYRCGIIGKWHLGAHPSLHPLNRGFDEFFGFLGGGHRYFPEELTLTDPSRAGNESESYRMAILRDHTAVETTRYLTDEFSLEAVDFIERNRDRPFFLYLAYNAPHAPLQASEEYLSRFTSIKDPRRRTYAAMVSAVDDGVGKVLTKLRELNLETETLVFFLSDNGGPLQANASSNDPLRGAKGSPWEGGWHVPFAMQWAGHIEPGTVLESPVISLDIFATVAALSAAPLDAARPLDGVNLMPYLTGRKSGAPHGEIFLRMFDRGAYAVRSGDFKLVIPQKRNPPELYNLREDLAESTNIAASHGDEVRRLNQERRRWDAQLVAPVFEGLNQGGGNRRGGSED